MNPLNEEKTHFQSFNQQDQMLNLFHAYADDDEALSETLEYVMSLFPVSESEKNEVLSAFAKFLAKKGKLRPILVVMPYLDGPTAKAVAAEVAQIAEEKAAAKLAKIRALEREIETAEADMENFDSIVCHFKFPVFEPSTPPKPIVNKNARCWAPQKPAPLKRIDWDVDSDEKYTPENTPECPSTPKKPIVNENVLCRAPKRERNAFDMHYWSVLESRANEVCFGKKEDIDDETFFSNAAKHFNKDEMEIMKDYRSVLDALLDC
jgi:hypothetical protein